MGKNNFKEQQNLNQWSLAEWKTKCAEGTYSLVEQNEIPNFIHKDLIEKSNCAVIASSGNTSTYIGIIMLYRIDKKEIDGTHTS